MRKLKFSYLLFFFFCTKRNGNFYYEVRFSLTNEEGEIKKPCFSSILSGWRKQTKAALQTWIVAISIFLVKLKIRKVLEKI